MKVVVQFDRALARRNTFFVLPDGTGIKARFSFGEGPEFVFETKLRYLKPWVQRD